MKRKRFTEEQIIAMLKEAEAGVPVNDLCRKHGTANASFYSWRAKYSGMLRFDVARGSVDSSTFIIVRPRRCRRRIFGHQAGNNRQSNP